MRPDLRNVVIEVEDEKNSQRRVMAHHRAFPEINAECPAPTEGLLALLGLLKRSSTSVMDDGHSLELAYAVFDVESLLKLLVSSDRLRICGYGSVITKTSDLSGRRVTEHQGRHGLDLDSKVRRRAMTAHR